MQHLTYGLEEPEISDNDLSVVHVGAETVMVFIRTTLTYQPFQDGNVEQDQEPYYQ